MKTKKITVLHSNDMHGDFFAEKTGERQKMIGGLSLLSGYVSRVRREEENVIYVISGDMVQGNLIDTEYKGISTMEIMNYLAPDVVALGNHEFDYGLPHLLFLEKMANFPIVNANLYIKPYNKRLMNPYHVIRMAGLDLLFTGIITEKIMDSLKQDKLIGSFVDLQEASREVGKICNAYKNEDIDLTVLLTHVGFESDKKLAALLKAEWGVDLIIGGHSHTVLEQPEKVNGVLIVQAGVGTDQIGRFDLIVDDDTNSIVDYRWQLVPIVEGIAEPDHGLLNFIGSFKKEVDRKYDTILCKFSNTLTHPQRETETSLGNLVADGLASVDNIDVMLVGAGSIRVNELGPVVTLKDLITCFPYDDTLNKITVTGTQLSKMFNHWMRNSNRNGEGECYEVNCSVRVVHDDGSDSVVSLTVADKPLVEDGYYSICLQGYHLNNVTEYLNLTPEEIEVNGGSKVVSTSAREVLEEYLRNNQNINKKIEGRLVYR